MSHAPHVWDVVVTERHGVWPFRKTRERVLMTYEDEANAQLHMTSLALFKDRFGYETVGMRRRPVPVGPDPLRRTRWGG